jgi:hypothetical protein
VSDNSSDYEARGIHPTTFACVLTDDRKKAERYAFALLAAGVEVRVARDEDGKRWHVAVRGGLSKSPLAWVIAIRGGEVDEDMVVTCHPKVTGQHPQTRRPAKRAKRAA